MPNPTLSGLAIGFVVGAGLFVFRLRLWPIAKILGILSFAAVVIAVGIGAFAALASFGKGGDSAIAGMTVLLLGGMGLMVAAVVALVAGAIQGSRMGLPAMAPAPSLLGEPLLLLLASVTFQYWFISPIERETTQRFINQESARRERMRRLKEAIPPKYREVDSYTLDAWERQQRQMEQMGVKGKPFISQDAANKLRNYWNATAEPQPVPDRSGYQIAGEAKQDFNKSIAGGWLVGAMLLPFCFPKRATSKSGSHRAAPDASIKPPPVTDNMADDAASSFAAESGDDPPPGFQV